MLLCTLLMFSITLGLAYGKSFSSMRQLGSIKLPKTKEKVQLPQDITYFLQSTTSDVQMSPSLSGDISIQYFAKDQYERFEQNETSDTLKTPLSSCEEEDKEFVEVETEAGLRIPEVDLEDVEVAKTTQEERDMFYSGDSGDHSNYSSRKVEEATAGVSEEGEVDSSSSSDAAAAAPMSVLRSIWRDMMLAPPSKEDIQHILRGERLGLSTASAAEGSGVEKANTATTPVATTEAAPTSAGAHHSQPPLRANGTDHESLYRQTLSQFLDPLAADSRRSLWLDQEFALNLKGAVVIAHQPELWKGIGEGLKPKLTRGLRLVTPYSELNSQGMLVLTMENYQFQCN